MCNCIKLEKQPGFYPGDEVSVTVTVENGNVSTRAKILREGTHGMYFRDVKEDAVFFVSWSAGLMMAPAYDEDE